MKVNLGNLIIWKHSTAECTMQEHISQAQKIWKQQQRQDAT